MDCEFKGIPRAHPVLESGLLRSLLGTAGAVVGRAFHWISRRWHSGHDAALLEAMSEAELKDIGLYAHNLPSDCAITPPSRRRDECVTMIDGLPFSRKF